MLSSVIVLESDKLYVSDFCLSHCGILIMGKLMKIVPFSNLKVLSLFYTLLHLYHVTSSDRYLWIEVQHIQFFPFFFFTMASVVA